MSVILRAVDFVLNGLGDWGIGPRAEARAEERKILAAKVAEQRRILQAIRFSSEGTQKHLWDSWEEKPDIVIQAVCKEMIATPFSEDFLCTKVRDDIIRWLQKTSYQTKAAKIKKVFEEMFFSTKEKADRNLIIMGGVDIGEGEGNITDEEFTLIAMRTKILHGKLDEVVMPFAQALLNVFPNPKKEGDLLENGCEALCLAIGGDRQSQMNFLHKVDVFNKVISKIRATLQILIGHADCSDCMREQIRLILRVLEHRELQERINNIIHRPGETSH